MPQSVPRPVLTRGGEVLGPVEVLDSRRARRVGLLGRDGVDGVVWLEPCRSVHSIGMRFPLDVAFCRRLPAGAAGIEVVRTVALAPGRVTRPVLRSGVVLEALAGCFAGWSLQAGDHLKLAAP